MIPWLGAETLLEFWVGVFAARAAHAFPKMRCYTSQYDQVKRCTHSVVGLFLLLTWTLIAAPASASCQLIRVKWWRFWWSLWLMWVLRRVVISGHEHIICKNYLGHFARRNMNTSGSDHAMPLVQLDSPLSNRANNMDIWLLFTWMHWDRWLPWVFVVQHFGQSPTAHVHLRLF